MDSPVKQAWDSFAEMYDRMVGDLGDINHRLIVNPCLIDLLGPIHGLRILDVGCGQGYFARLLAKEGAEVYGVDISTRMIELAEAQQTRDGQPLPTQYLCQSAAQPLPFEPGFFDAVVFNMSLMNIEDAEATLRNATRSLRVGGVLLVSILHPCFINRGAGWTVAGSYLDGAQTQAGYRIDNYFDTRVTECKWGDMREPVHHFHRTLGEYVSFLCSCDLLVSDIREPKSNHQYRKELTANDPVWVQGDRIPLYLVVKAVRQPSVGQ